MNTKEMRQRVLEANKSLKTEGLIISTWGNVSEYDEEAGLIAIKASGVPYDDMTIDDIVVTDMDGNIVESDRRPSTDLKTHLILYKEFKGVKSIVHTHAMYSTIWAQAGKDIPLLGTTHADYFSDDIPCCRGLSKTEIEEDYEVNTGKVIAETFRERNLDPLTLKAALAKGHANFVWGNDPHDAVHNAIILEFIAHMAWCNAAMADGELKKLDPAQRKKHYDRKFGKNAYYGQK